MGDYNIIRSIQSPCCKSGWFHKLCLSKYADAASLFMKCTICNRKIDEFRRAIEKRGVFIPERYLQRRGILALVIQLHIDGFPLISKLEMPCGRNPSKVHSTNLNR